MYFSFLKFRLRGFEERPPPYDLHSVGALIIAKFYIRVSISDGYFGNLTLIPK